MDRYDGLPVSLGEQLTGVMEFLGIDTAQLAARCGLSRKHIWALRNGRAQITCETSLKLQQGTGMAAVGWMLVDVNHRLALIRQAMRKG